MDHELPPRFPGTFDDHYGLVYDRLDLEAGEVLAHVDVEDHHKQPAGLVHGGVLASIAESITSMATWSAVQADGKSAQGLSNQTSFLRPVLGGTIHARAVARHRGRTTWVWEVEITDDEQRLCSLVRMTIAVR
jgi:1,4-dihydroxy-2-naphthoyl-CoA hydrolase